MTVKNRILTAAAVTLVLSSGASPARAGKPTRKVFEPGLLWGVPASPEPAPVERDPWLPTGPALPSPIARPPAEAEPPACSDRVPVCVHRAAGVSDAAALTALAALETAYVRLVVALRLPAPLPDRGLGGTDALDLYLSARSAPLATGHDAPALIGFDAAPAFCALGDDTLIERDATLCVAEAITWRLAPATTPFLRRAYAAHLWRAVGAPTSRDADALDLLQASPERGIAGGASNDLAEGAALFADYLEAHGDGAPGRLTTALVAAAATQTPPRAFEWDDDPDLFDVLRHNFDGDTRRMADMLGDFAVTRAFIGDRGDGSLLPELDFAGPFARVRFDWRVPLSSLPRNLASVRPISPTGSIYLWVDIDRASADRTFAFHAEWEPPVTFKWILLKVGKGGEELARYDVTFEDHATVAERRISELEGAAGILIVGTNLGGVDLLHPFDPDVAPYEPHACSVYLVML
ncbi:MAG: hypothetical protein OZ921_11805 [Sorangiineae bacterium]|nr:hypothetical protein [Polyangiaceae bacterium]MEB2323192.1 hypothetical protein [Sorangiineae bacterium]